MVSVMHLLRSQLEGIDFYRFGILLPPCFVVARNIPLEPVCEACAFESVEWGGGDIAVFDQWTVTAIVPQEMHMNTFTSRMASAGREKSVSKKLITGHMS